MLLFVVSEVPVWLASVDWLEAPISELALELVEGEAVVEGDVVEVPLVLPFMEPLFWAALSPTLAG